MINKNITIELFRVDTTSLYLDAIFTCPNEYYFNYFELEARVLDQDGNFQSHFFDLSPALFDTDTTHEGCTNNRKHWVVRIPLDKLGISNMRSIYMGTIKALNDNDLIDTPLEAKPICSDVNGVYKCLLEDLIGDNCDNECAALNDRSIMNFLILYGHEAAMQEDHIEEAEQYYKLLANCFAKCKCNLCREVPKIIKSCNCN